MAILENFESSGSDEPTGPAVAEQLLCEGQRLDQPTFHAIYEQFPEDFRAELIDGVVCLMNMPLHADHAGPDSLMIGFLVTYSLETPGTKVLNNLSTVLGPRSEVQPDSCLIIKSDHGGRSRLDEKGYMIDAPELVVEIGSSTLKRDLDAKKQVYQEAGTLEYVVFDAQKHELHWFILRDGRFEALAVDAEGLYRSETFPGLWIDPVAFSKDDGSAGMAGLRRGLDSPEHAAFVERLRQNRANRP